MGKRITSVSFDTIGVQVVTILSTGSGVTVERALIIQTDELEAFLAVDACTEYLVAINPADAIYETIQIPPVDSRLEETIIKAEAARQNPELGSFSCSYQSTGKTSNRGKTSRNVSCCLISHATIFSYLEPFIRQNKAIQKIVAIPHILATLVNTHQDLPQEPILCAHDSGQSKTLFLLDNGAVVFSRSIASNGYGWDPIDRQNIAMTLDYCFQALRIRARRVLVLNLQQKEDPEQPFPRLEQLTLTERLSNLDPDILMTKLVPLSLATCQLEQTCNLLPDKYRSERFKQVVYRSGMMLYAVILVLLVIVTGYQLYEISSLKQNIKTQLSQLIELRNTL